MGWTQGSQSLRQRIRKADPNEYRSIKDGQDWKNPYLIVHPDGIEIIELGARRPVIDVRAIPGVLQGLPDSAWPYGLVVAVQDAGLVSSAADTPRVASNRTALLEVLKKLGVVVELWPSA
jgi:hypothetical protein